ncbi:MAG: flippase-like domain-containing protein [Nitrososphaerota archaeon]
MKKAGELLKRPLAGIIASIGITLLIVTLSRMPLATLLSIPLPLILLSLGLCASRLLAQGLRFHILVRHHSSVRIGLGEAFMVRGVSEFFALTTIPFMADEVVRAWILTDKGEETVTATLIAFAELILDVLVSATMAFIAGVAALTRGEMGVAMVLFTIPASQLALIITLALQTRHHGLERLLSPTGWLRRRIPIGERLLNILRHVGTGSSKFLEALTVGRGKAILAALLAVTVAVMSIPAVTLYIVLSRYTVISFIDALFAFHAGNVLGVLPVTAGGSGLTEAGAYLYSSRILEVDSWEAVVLWRILTYYLTILVTGVMFAYYSQRMVRQKA